jgi:hypothetical protein
MEKVNQKSKVGEFSTKFWGKLLDVDVKGSVKTI